ncbi:MAG: antibiotic biosynthesis monooxygenase [Bryobacteraceae bacterium]|jgi:heme-degrading monooxygenase HmoA
MIARHWRGWTEVENADAYEALLKNKVLPGLRAIEGYRGGYILRYDGSPQFISLPEVEFAVISFFESLDAVKRFAGSDYTAPVFEQEAKKLLSRADMYATHYEVRAAVPVAL